MITLFLGLLIWVSLASADYFMIEPTGKMVPVKRVGDTFQPINKSTDRETVPTAIDPGWIDSICYYTYSGHYYYPNRDSNTIVMTWVTPEYPCSLIAVRFDFYSPGYVELYVWDAYEYEDIESTEEMEDTLYATWTFECDTLGPGNWVSWPTVLYGPVLMGSDEPEDQNTRTVTHELSPHLYVGTDDFYCGYRLITRFNPDGFPYGGKPWPTSDGACEDGSLCYEPCRGWMYRVQYTSGLHCSWVDYGLDPGMWDMMFIIDIVANAPPKILRVDKLLSTYNTGDRIVTADFFDLGVPSESSGVASASIVYYTIHDGDTTDPASVPMTLVSGTAKEGTWSGEIPGQTPVTKVIWKITATDYQVVSSETYDASYYVAAGTADNWFFVEQPNAYYGVLHDPIAANCTNFDLWTYGTPDSFVINFYTPGKGTGQPLMYFTGWDLAWVANAQDEIASALDNGAALVLCSQDGLHTFYPEAEYDSFVVTAPGEFLYDYLKVLSFIDDFTESEDTTVIFYGEATDPISGPFEAGIQTSFACWAGSGYFWPGAITEFSSDATGIFRYENGEISGYRYEDAAKGYKIVYLFWHPDYVISEWCVAGTHTQDTLISNILKWFGVVGIEEKVPFVSANFFLSQNWPNPTTSVTTINYHLPSDCEVALEVYDVSGRLIETIVRDKKSAGTHSVIWDGRDVKGEELPSGIYFYRLKALEFESIRKMVILR
jgi:hypothetical protein